MFFWIKIGLFVVILAIVGGIYAKYQHVMEENVTLKANVDKLTQVVTEQDATINQLKKDEGTLQRILVTKAKKEQALNAQINKLRSTISDLEAKDPVIRAWASELIPPAVIDSLRDSGLSNADQGGQATGTGGVGFGNTSPSGGPQVQPGLSRPSGQVPGSTTGLQQR